MHSALAATRTAFLAVAGASTIVNMLMLVGPIFMLQVYDRVLPSRSLPTLIGLLIIAAVLLVIQAVSDSLRSRLLSRMGDLFDEVIRPAVFASVQYASVTRAHDDGQQTLRDLDTVRRFIAGTGLVAVCDLPWTPLYIGLCFLFHPLMGVAVAAGAAILALLTVAAETSTREPTRALVGLASSRRMTAETAVHHADVVRALGMEARLSEIWQARNAAYLAGQRKASDLSGGFGSLSRFFRMTMQSGVLAIGAYLVINQQATAGVMLAATILSIRALAPIELAIANWRGFIACRESFARICERLDAVPRDSARTALPTPRRDIKVNAVSLTAPGTDRLVLHDVTFEATAGSAVAIVGPSGSGKSTLARALSGIGAPVRGVIRFDGAALDQFDPVMLGRSVGFLPQDVVLFRGTVAQNICRFTADPDANGILEAARQAGVHDMIVRFPNGYDTEVGEGGMMMSGGQRQRIALARALYGNPFLLVLDEPNSNLDLEGERALIRAILHVRARGAIVVIVAHRPTLVSAVDHLLVLNGGRMQAFGKTSAVLPLLAERRSQANPVASAPAPAPAKAAPRAKAGRNKRTARPSAEARP
jgi:PrtD family type I secretion system ABC transporter